MEYILGLDTGGTYTDGVLIDAKTGTVLRKAKTLTTKHDLKEGLAQCMDMLNICNTGNIKMVALSTTLATNAVVENRVGKTGLILIGGKRLESMPTDHIEIVGGSMDIRGNVIIPVSKRQAEAAVMRLRDKVDAIAISSYASVRNPAQELEVKRIVEEKTEIPVFCGHELTGSLGYVERTATAVLNAGLIRIVEEFISATKETLKERNIEAEVMIVKSDGCLMKADAAMKRPIDTILSGPAASMIGALQLTGAKDALVLDMGGTTIDIANVTEKGIGTDDECARVSQWITRVHAVRVSTHGIGGDSWIKTFGKIDVGPQKAEPVSRMAYCYRYYYDELLGVYNDDGLSPGRKEELSRGYCLITGRHLYNGEAVHDALVNLLREEPHSISYLNKNAGVETYGVLKKMHEDGEVNIIDMTPTDILHIMNRYTAWNVRAAMLRGSMVARAGGLSLDEFVQKAEETIYKKIFIACLQAVSDFENENIDISDDKAALYLVDKMFSQKDEDFLKVGCRLRKPLIAVGAPAKAWLSHMAKKMNAEIIIPEDADAANAVGSAFGEISEFAEALLRKEPGKRKYNLYLPAQKKIYYSKTSALREAESILKEEAERRARDSGCCRAEVKVDCRDTYMNPYGESRKRYVETRIKASAKGRPDSWKESE